MNPTRGFLNQFLHRQGHWMLVSHGVVKVFGFAAVVAVTRLVLSLIHISEPTRH